MRIFLSSRASRKLLKIIAYLKKRSPAGTQSVRHALQGSFTTLKTFPDAGRSQSVAGIRCLIVPRYAYRLYYRREGDAIIIVSIQHPAEQPEYGDD